MSAFYRLKAYFGMVPAEDLDDLAYGSSFGPAYEGDDPSAAGDYDYDPGYERGRRPAERRNARSRWTDEDAYPEDEGYYDDEPEPARSRRAATTTARGWAADTRGALAVDTTREAGREVREAREVAARTRPAPAEEVHPLARITTLHPRSYYEARTIGEHYREGTPVIMNLTEMEDADAKRLVDFAAGLAFALRGSIDKITTRVFLISPPNVDVTAEDRRRLAEGSFLNRS